MKSLWDQRSFCFCKTQISLRNVVSMTRQMHFIGNKWRKVLEIWILNGCLSGEDSIGDIKRIDFFIMKYLEHIEYYIWVGKNIDWVLHACGHFPVGKNKHVIRGRHKNLISYLVLSVIFCMDYYIHQWKIMTFFYTNRVSFLKNKSEL